MGSFWNGVGVLIPFTNYASLLKYPEDRSRDGFRVFCRQAALDKRYISFISRRWNHTSDYCRGTGRSKGIKVFKKLSPLLKKSFLTSNITVEIILVNTTYESSNKDLWNGALESQHFQFIFSHLYMLLTVTKGCLFLPSRLFDIMMDLEIFLR